jgi:hypothetical protein
MLDFTVMVEIGFANGACRRDNFLIQALDVSEARLKAVEKAQVDFPSGTSFRVISVL